MIATVTMVAAMNVMAAMNVTGAMNGTVSTGGTGPRHRLPGTSHTGDMDAGCRVTGVGTADTATGYPVIGRPGDLTGILPAGHGAIIAPMDRSRLKVIGADLICCARYSVLPQT